MYVPVTAHRYPSATSESFSLLSYAQRFMRKIPRRVEQSPNTVHTVDAGSTANVLNGRYGPYITDRERNARIPKDRDPKSLTLEECKALLEAAPLRPARGRFGRGARGKMKGKAAPKAAAAKAAAPAVADAAKPKAKAKTKPKAKAKAKAKKKRKKASGKKAAPKAVSEAAP